MSEDSILDLKNALMSVCIGTALSMVIFRLVMG